jgi:hypothetical protein
MRQAPTRLYPTGFADPQQQAWPDDRSAFWEQRRLEFSIVLCHLQSPLLTYRKQSNPASSNPALYAPAFDTWQPPPYHTQLTVHASPAFANSAARPN